MLRSKLCPEIEFVKRDSKMTLVRRCSKGRGCSCAHSKEEELYHPSVYKTKMCNAQPSCARYFCPFAHSIEEIRKSYCEILTTSAGPPTSTIDSQTKNISSGNNKAAASTSSDAKRRSKDATQRSTIVATPLCPGSPLSSSSTTASSVPSPVLACLSPVTGKSTANEGKAWRKIVENKRNTRADTEVASSVSEDVRQKRINCSQSFDRYNGEAGHKALSTNNQKLEVGQRSTTAGSVQQELVSFNNRTNKTDGTTFVSEQNKAAERELKAAFSTVAKLLSTGKNNRVLQNFLDSLKDTSKPQDGSPNDIKENVLSPKPDRECGADYYNTLGTERTIQQLISSLTESPPRNSRVGLSSNNERTFEGCKLQQNNYQTTNVRHNTSGFNLGFTCAETPSEFSEAMTVVNNVELCTESQQSPFLPVGVWGQFFEPESMTEVSQCLPSLSPLSSKKTVQTFDSRLMQETRETPKLVQTSQTMSWLPVVSSIAGKADELRKQNDYGPGIHCDLPIDSWVCDENASFNQPGISSSDLFTRQSLQVMSHEERQNNAFEFPTNGDVCALLESTSTYCSKDYWGQQQNILFSRKAQSKDNYRRHFPSISTCTSTSYGRDNTLGSPLEDTQATSTSCQNTLNFDILNENKAGEVEAFCRRYPIKMGDIHEISKQILEDTHSYQYPIKDTTDLFRTNITLDDGIPSLMKDHYYGSLDRSRAINLNSNYRDVELLNANVWSL